MTPAFQAEAEPVPTDAVVLRDLAHLLERGGEPYGWIPNRLRAIAGRLETLEAGLAKVLEGFDLGVFVRDITHDHEPDWAIRAAPYLAALGRLAKAAEEAEPQPTTVMRVRFEKQGGHYHCRLFTARRTGQTFAKNGALVFDEAEWPDIPLLMRGAEFVDEVSEWPPGSD